MKKVNLIKPGDFAAGSGENSLEGEMKKQD